MGPDGSWRALLAAQDGHMFQTQPAPGPDEIHWMGLWSTQRERFIRCIFAWPFLLFFILFPVGFFSGEGAVPLLSLPVYPRNPKH